MKKWIGFIGIVAVLFACHDAPQSIPQPVEQETIHSLRRYIYVNGSGKRVVFQNSLPKGIGYTAPDGKRYSRLLFWTRIINETADSLELKAEFPAEGYEVPAMPGKRFRILIPADTMTPEQTSLYDYGISGLNTFLDEALFKPSSIRRMVSPGNSTGLYVVVVFDNDVPGPTRAGFHIEGQQLVYKIARYHHQSIYTPIDEKEIRCGSINLSDLVPKQQPPIR